MAYIEDVNYVKCFFQCRNRGCLNVVDRVPKYSHWVRTNCSDDCSSHSVIFNKVSSDFLDSTIRKLVQWSWVLSVAESIVSFA